MCIPGAALSRYINFYTDFAFKKIFGTEANKDLLISFLNGLLELQDGDEITDLTYLTTEQLGDLAGERRAIYDVYCKTAKGERFIVEMQRAEQSRFRDRALYYSSFAIREQGIRGGRRLSWDYSLSPVYVVGILDFVMDANKQEVITKVSLKDENNQVFSDKLNFIFLEMPKFRKGENELNSFIDKWLFVIKNLYRLENQPSSLTEGIFRKLFSVAEIANFSSEERYDYEESLKNFRDMQNTLDTAEQKGREKGLKEGKAEEKRAIARSMKADGLPVETIAKYSGLSVAEIKNL